MTGGKNKNPGEDKDDTDNRPVPRSPLTEMWDNVRKDRNRPDDYSSGYKKRKKESDDE
jgi:hypothetical protein